MENPDNVAADRPLRRSELAVKLTKAGFPIATQTLARLAVEGSGPPFRIWARFPICNWPDALR